MNRARANLNAQNATVVLPLSAENHNGDVSIWLGAGAAGTVVLEVGNRSKPATSGKVEDETIDWAQVKLWNPLTAVNAAVDSIAGAAGAQYLYASVIGAEFVRARKSSNDTSDCWTIITFKKGPSNH